MYFFQISKAQKNKLKYMQYFRMKPFLFYMYFLNKM